MDQINGTFGTGRITRIFDKFAFIRPDHYEYGTVHIQARHAGVAENLWKIFKIGDRVKFKFTKSTYLRGKCQWDGHEVTKISDDDEASAAAAAVDVEEKDKESDPKSGNVYWFKKGEKFLKNAQGTIKKSYDYHGWIQVRRPFFDEAYFEINGMASFTPDLLSISYPPGTDVSFDLKEHTFKGERGWRAVGVRRKSIILSTNRPEIENIDSETSDRNGDTGSQISDRVLSNSETQISENSSTAMIKSEAVEPKMESDRSSTVEMSTQTESMTETAILSQLFDDKETFDFICQRQPSIIHKWINIRMMK